MAKFYAKATRDFVREIALGPLVVVGMQSGKEREVAPPRVHRLEIKGGSVSVHRTRRDRDAYIAACNADAPGAVIAWEG